MGSLIDALLRFSKIGKTGIHRIPIDMYSLAQSVADELCTTVKVKPEITIDPLPQAYGDEILVTQVLKNLLSNAIKYSSKKNTSADQDWCYR